MIDSTDNITKEEAYRYLSDSKTIKRYLPVNAGYNKHSVWIYISPKSIIPGLAPQVIRLNHTLLDSVEVWVNDSCGLKHWASMGNLSYKKWPALPAPIPGFVLPTERITDALIKVKTTDVCALSIESSDIWNFNRSILKVSSFFWLYFGAICLLFIINFSLSIAMNSASFLWYSIYVMTFAFFQSAVCGFISLWNFDFVPLIRNIVPLFGSLSVASGSLFAKSFLELKTCKFKFLYNMFTFFFITGLISTILSLYQDGRFASINLSILAPLFVITGLVVGLFSIPRMGRPATLFSLGILMLVIGIVLNALRNFGLLPDTTITAHGNLFGSILEFIIMTIALVDRISKNE
ncbi:MAG TPA: 7TM-DISM domain-containing protein, partial [Chitinispirillaceae bacterium]|nr:7TM-DISM domain-containing protein [Chitinispirillaceae bacterium]